jgi:hypothetical protein
MWELIKNHIKLLMSFVSLCIGLAHVFYNYEAGKFTSYLLKDILFVSIPLTYVYLRANNIPVNISCFAFHRKQVSSIEHLSLRNMRIDLEHCYSVAVALRTLDAKLAIYYPAYKFHMNPSENLKILSLKIHQLCFSTIEQLLYQMKRLTHFIIIAYSVYHDMSDGAAWERILTKIISFKFSFSFHKSTWVEERSNSTYSIVILGRKETMVYWI